MKHLLVAALIAGIVGCAEQRFLTKEQDAEFRANCEGVGCACMPRPDWERIEQLLRRLGMWRDA